MTPLTEREIAAVEFERQEYRIRGGWSFVLFWTVYLAGLGSALLVIYKVVVK